MSESSFEFPKFFLINDDVEKEKLIFFRINYLTLYRIT